MEEKENKLILDVECTNGYSGCISEEINNEEYDIHFCVCDLSECPEDAIIGRRLFDVGNYIDALNKGIELAKKGYTYVGVNIIESNEEDDE